MIPLDSKTCNNMIQECRSMQSLIYDGLFETCNSVASGSCKKLIEMYLSFSFSSKRI